MGAEAENYAQMEGAANSSATEATVPQLIEFMEMNPRIRPGKRLSPPRNPSPLPRTRVGIFPRVLLVAVDRGRWARPWCTGSTLAPPPGTTAASASAATPSTSPAVRPTSTTWRRRFLVLLRIMSSEAFVGTHGRGARMGHVVEEFIGVILGAINI